MSAGGALLLFAALVGLGLAAYWTVVISEGSYLGSRWVVALYDRTAGGYDSLKEFDEARDDARLVQPLLAGAPHTARVLDVATGTARIPLALLADPSFEGEVVGVDLAVGMLEAAWRKVGGWWPRVHLVRAPADNLPFADATFDVVTMVEALEFTPQPRRTLAELHRVLRPGGLLLVTNRIGWEARLLPGRAFRPPAFETVLEERGFTAVRTERWQTYYDLVWARRPAPDGAAAESGAWPAGALCVCCGAALAMDTPEPACSACGWSAPWSGGFWDFTARPEAPAA